LPSSTPNSHEYFEELCSLSAGGHLDSEERIKLDAHLAECTACRGFYAEMGSLIAELNLNAEAVFSPEPSSTRTAESDISASAKDTSKTAILRMPTPISEEFSPAIADGRWGGHWGRIAAALICGVALGLIGMSLRDRHTATTITGPTDRAALKTAATTRAETDETLALAAAQSRIRGLEAALQAAQIRNGSPVKPSVSSIQEDKAQQIAALLRQIADVDQRDAAQRNQIAVLSAEIDKLNQVHEQDIQGLQTRDARIHLLTADLVATHSQETASVKSVPPADSAGVTSVADLLGQRNLHVIDVYDQGSHGQRTAAFGRVFYGEGASLLFYAFDLPVKLGSDKVVIQAWGQREGSAKNPVKLGIFTQNDPLLPRWMLRVKNPGQLSKIDAVFVTVERREEKKPTGTPMLYAYLRQAPNHP
jgi:anti-sigma factor RsiW